MGLGGMIYVPSFIKISTDAEGILRFCLSNQRGHNVGITHGRDLKCAIEMGSGGMIYIPSSMAIGSGI
jgi:hypothetical protein